MRTAAPPLVPDGPERASAPVRIGLGALLGILTVNAFTGTPILSLWIASKANGDGPLKMGSIGVFVLVMAVISIALFQVLKRVSYSYDRATGTPLDTRKPLPWLESMRGERANYGGPPRLKPQERVLCGVVIVAVVAFEIWFFFFSTSPIDNRSGRDGWVDPPTPLVVAALPR